MRKFVGVFVFVVAPLLNADCFAATDGSLGNPSTGSTNISITLPNQVRITGVADLNLGEFSGSGNLTSNDDVCIYTNDSGGQYQVTAHGDGAGSAFTVSDPSSNTIPYEVYWNDSTGTTGNVELSTNITLGTQSSADTTDENCSGGNTANFQVVVRESELSGQLAATFSGVLTLVIEPN